MNFLFDVLQTKLVISKQDRHLITCNAYSYTHLLETIIQLIDCYQPNQKTYDPNTKVKPDGLFCYSLWDDYGIQAVNNYLKENHVYSLTVPIQYLNEYNGYIIGKEDDFTILFDTQELLSVKDLIEIRDKLLGYRELFLYYITMT